MQHSLQRKRRVEAETEAAAARWSLWNVQCLCKISVTLTELVNTSSSHNRQTVNQSVWRSQAEQPGPVWMWRENSRQEEMRRVRRKGGNKEKVFGCDLLEHLNASSQEGKWTVTIFFMTGNTIQTKHHAVQINNNTCACNVTRNNSVVTIKCWYNTMCIDLDRAPH